VWIQLITEVDTASKGGVLALTRELAMVHAREGIRVNSLCPYVSLLRTSVHSFAINTFANTAAL
jgi:NAD(P)-dependent dehydrogenase (short-subunit alcohol dehydrogenase family)